MRKRLDAAILAIGMIISLTACKTASDQTEDANAVKPVSAGAAECESMEGPCRRQMALIL